MIHLIILLLILECYINSKDRYRLNAVITAAVVSALTAIGVSTGAAIAVGVVAAVAVYGGLALAMSSMKTDGLENSPTYQDQKATQTNPDLPIPLIYGTVKTAGNKIWQNSEENDDSEQVKYIVKKIVAFAEGEITGYEDVRVNDYTYKQANQYAWGYAEAFYGTNTQGLPKDPDFWKWSNMHGKTRFDEIGSMKNVAYIYFKLPLGERLSKDFNATAIVHGRKIRVYTTPTNYTITYSENPAWVMFDFLTAYNGRGLCLNDYGQIDDAKVAELFDMQSFIEAAAYCDEVIYTNGVPKKRFTFNMIFDTQVSHKTLIDEIQRSCRGGLFTKNGKLQFKVDKPEAVSKVFTEADIIDGSETFQTLANEEHYDILKINYISPQHEWNKVQAFAEIPTTGTELPKEHTINCLSVTNFQQASRLAWYYLNSKRLCPYFGSFKTGYKAYDLEVGQVIEIPVMLMGLQNYKVKITSVVDNGTGTYTVNYRNYDERLYNDQLGCQEPTVIVTDLTDQYANPADVTNFNVVQNQSIYEFVWDYNANTMDTYEIRYGETWETGTIIGKNIAVNKFSYAIQTKGLKRFWIKAFNGLNYSTNATMDVIQINDIPNMNEIVSIDVLEDIQGTHYHTKGYHNTIKPILYDDLDYPTQIFNPNKITKVGSPTITDGKTPTTNYTVVGSPTITDGRTPKTEYTIIGHPIINYSGIAENFSTSNYLVKQNAITTTSTGEFHIDFVYEGIQATTLQYIFDVYGTTGNEIVVRRNQNSDTYQCLVFVSGVAVFNVSVNDTSNNITGYVEYKNGVYTFDINGTKRILASTTKPNALIYNLSIGARLVTGTAIDACVNGSIDLNKFIISVDNVEVYRAWELRAAGIASGLSSSNYLKTNISLGNANTWEIFVKNFTYLANTTTNYNLVVGNNNTGSLNLNLFFNEGFKSIIISFSADGTSTFGNIQFTYSAISLESNDILDIKLEFTGTAYVAKFINKNKNKEYIQTLTNSTKINNSEILIGGYRTMTGSIDLKQFSISTNGVEIYRAWEIEEAGLISNFSNNNYITTNNFKIAELLNHSWSIITGIVTGITSDVYGDRPLYIAQSGFAADGTIGFYGTNKTIYYQINTPSDSSPETRANNRISLTKTLDELPEKIQFRLDFDYSTGIYSGYYDIFDGSGWQLAGTITPATNEKQLYDIVYNNNRSILVNRRDNATENTTVIDMKPFAVNVDGEKVYAPTSPDYYLWHTTTDTWNDGEEYYRNGNLWGAKVYNDGYYISQVYDVFENAPAYVFADMMYSSADLANYCLLQIRTSEDNITWSDWKSASITNETFRYIQFKVIFNVFNNIPLVCTKLIASVDVPDKILNMEAEVTNANDGVTINYEFNTIPSIVATVQDSNAKYAVVPDSSKTKTSAIIYIYNNSGTKTTGKLSLVLKGY